MTLWMKIMLVFLTSLTPVFWDLGNSDSLVKLGKSWQNSKASIMPVVDLCTYCFRSLAGSIQRPPSRTWEETLWESTLRRHSSRAPSSLSSECLSKRWLLMGPTWRQLQPSQEALLQKNRCCVLNATQLIELKLFSESSGFQRSFSDWNAGVPRGRKADGADPHHSRQTRDQVR